MCPGNTSWKVVWDGVVRDKADTEITLDYGRLGLCSLHGSQGAIK